ncbi:MAG TPA: hypothetical protein DCL68_02575 [Gammaproteobacteria bacterium]|nr:hypothetical protein [Gammaproteobacteria bacterium]|tara:strand:- start:997 stop:1464 length:468 start_codon:yes stop_codon:yes gene_type:complete
MNDIINFWNLRSQRERNLISISFALIALMAIISIFSWVMSNTKSSKAKMINAKNDYEYVYNGALSLLGKKSNSLLKNNPSEIIDSIRSIASVNGVSVSDVSLDDEIMTIILNAQKLEEIIFVLESLHIELALKITKLDLISNDDEMRVTLVYGIK